VTLLPLILVEIKNLNWRYIMIMQFRDSFLSSFWPATVYGYPSVENAYQAAKTTDKALRQQFRKCASAQAKRLGRKLPLLDAVMETLVRRKFEDVGLRANLVATGDEELVEGNNWHDNFWGDCSCGRCRMIAGENQLGKILMGVRANQLKS